MAGRLIRNAAKCAHCGLVLESTHRHDFRDHSCKQGPVLGKCKEWHGKGADMKLVETDEDDYPYFAVDGGLCYVRRVFSRKEDYIELSEYANE